MYKDVDKVGLSNLCALSAGESGAARYLDPALTSCQDAAGLWAEVTGGAAMARSGADRCCSFEL